MGLLSQRYAMGCMLPTLVSSYLMSEALSIKRSLDSDNRRQAKDNKKRLCIIAAICSILPVAPLCSAHSAVAAVARLRMKTCLPDARKAEAVGDWRIDLWAIVEEQIGCSLAVGSVVVQHCSGGRLDQSGVRSDFVARAVRDWPGELVTVDAGLPAAPAS